MFEERKAAGKPSHCENYLTDTFRQTVQHPGRCLLFSFPFSPFPSLPPKPSSPFSPPCFLSSPCPVSLSLPDCWVIQMVPLSTVNGVRPGREGRGYKRRPDNNVTIWLPPPWTSRAVEESESKQWSFAEGVSGRGERRGERGMQGRVWGAGVGSVSQGLDAGRSWEGAEMCVFVGVCARWLVGRAQRSQGSSTPVLACGLCSQVCALKTHYCTDSLAYRFCCQ